MHKHESIVIWCGSLLPLLCAFDVEWIFNELFDCIYLFWRHLQVKFIVSIVTTECKVFYTIYCIECNIRVMFSTLLSRNYGSIQKVYSETFSTYANKIQKNMDNQSMNAHPRWGQYFLMSCSAKLLSFLALSLKRSVIQVIREL